MAIQIQSRRDTAANWTSNDPTLAAGEIGVETDTLKMKAGDGSTAWTSLAYIGGVGDVTAGANLTDETIVQGDGGVKGVKTSTATIADIENNTASGVTILAIAEENTASGVTILSLVDENTASGATILAIAEENTASGVTILALVDENTASCATILAIADENTASGATILTLVDENTASCSTILTAHESLSSVYAIHAADTSDPHGANLTQTHISISSGTITSDITTSGLAYIAPVIYATGDPAAASDYPRGTIHVQYTE